MNTMQLLTPRLIVDQLGIPDLEDFLVYRSNPEVTRYQGFDVMDANQATAFITSNAGAAFGQPGQWVQYAIRIKETGRLIGDCAVKLDAHDVRIAEIGITISHLEQQKGYAGEVMTALIGFLFKEQNVHRVVETVDAENTASVRLLESTGFRKEGHFIENIFFKGRWGSEFQYAMLRREWTERYRIQPQ